MEASVVRVNKKLFTVSKLARGSFPYNTIQNMRFRGNILVSHRKRDYLTYWNIMLQGFMFAIVILFYVPITLFGKSLAKYQTIQKAFLYTIIPLTLMSVAYTFAIRFTVIDHMVDENDNLNIEKMDQIDVKNMYDVVRKDYQIHLLPIAIALILLFAMFTTTSLSPTSSLTVFLLTAAYACVMFFAWFLIPAKRVEGDPPGPLVMSNKIRALYGKFSVLNVLYFVSAFSVALIAQILLLRQRE